MSSDWRGNRFRNESEWIWLASNEFRSEPFTREALDVCFPSKSSQASPRHQRQLHFIRQYTTDIKYGSGEENTVANAFSRVATIDMPVVVSTEELAEQQANDEELQRLIGPESTTLLQLRRLRLDNTDAYVYCDISGTDVRPYVPLTRCKRIFDTTHILSHPSSRSAKKMISRRFVWPSMNKDIADWARTCLQCQRSKLNRHNRNVPQHIAIPDSRFHHIHLDIVGPLPPSQGCRYLLTMIDRFSCWPEAVPMSDISADTIIKTSFNSWIFRYGAPAIVITDRGPHFESHEN